MSAETLRKAAALMRKRVAATLREHEPAEPGWYAHLMSDGRAWVANSDGKWLSVHGMPGSAEHIASWHPAVALAVADWLDWVAECRTVIDGVAEQVRRAGREPQGPGKPTQMFLDIEEKALAVARAYLGGDQ